jgi:hypothetical protein
MHDTHPLLSYFPKEPVATCSGWRCGNNEFGWTPRTYAAEDGTLVSWHELRSRSESYRNTWGVEATFTGGSGISVEPGVLVLS